MQIRRSHKIIFQADNLLVHGKMSSKLSACNIIFSRQKIIDMQKSMLDLRKERYWIIKFRKIMQISLLNYFFNLPLVHSLGITADDYIIVDAGLIF